MQKKFLALLIYAAITLVTASGQTGGSYDLSHNVVASGGGTSSGGAFRVDGTVGQALAGTTSSGGQFSILGGFWTQAPLAPTAANVSLSGRVTRANGGAIHGAAITLAGSDGSTRTAYTNSLGYFRFLNVEAGDTYIISVSARRYTFADPARILTVQDNVTNADFVAQ